MSRNDVITRVENLNNVFNEAKVDAVHHALGLVSDDVMSVEEQNEVMDKAELIMKGAISQIMRNCDFYGDESIFQFNNGLIKGSYSCKEFLIALVEACSEDFDDIARKK